MNELNNKTITMVRKSKTSSCLWVGVLCLFLGLLLGYYVGKITCNPDAVDPRCVPQPKSSSANIITTVSGTVAGPGKSARVYVTSYPAGADIIVENLFYGRTPMELNVPLNQKVNITFKKEGFDILNQDFTASQSPAELRITLKKSN